MLKTCIVILVALLPWSARAGQLNGFDTGSLQVVRVNERAPSLAAISNIKHVKAPGNWNQNTYVLGAVVDGQPIAYPLTLLMWHWILNDTVENQPVVVVFCQICGSGWLYRRNYGGKVLTFNASGLLYRYDMLLFDNETKSLWSWETDTAVAGPFKQTALAPIPIATTTLRSWLQHYPESLIVEDLGSITGIDYRFTPNDTSALGESVFSGLRVTVAQIHPYTPVVGVIVDDKAIAIPATEVLHAGGKVNLTVGNDTLKVAFNVDQQKFTTSKNVPVTITNLLDWRHKHPATSIFTAKSN